MDEDAKFWGIDPADLRAGEEVHEGVWPENVAAVRCFLAGATQWRIVGMADGSMRVTGLDYAGLRVALEALETGITPELWSDMQLIEAGALGGLNKVKS